MKKYLKLVKIPFRTLLSTSTEMFDPFIIHTNIVMIGKPGSQYTSNAGAPSIVCVVSIMGKD